MSVDFMIYKWEHAYSLSIENKHLKRDFKWRLTVDEAK
jgi:hypothetical protein